MALPLAGLLVLVGCSGGGTDSPGIAPRPTFSNLTLDRLGAAVAVGQWTEVRVTALAGALEALTVTSSDPNVVGVGMASTASTATIAVNGIRLGRATITVRADSGGSRQFPVTVYDPNVLDAGELEIKLVDQFEFRWNDQGSGANSDGACWHPIVPAPDYHALGSLGMTDYSNPNGRTWAVVVKDKGTNPANPPIVEPVSYEPVLTVVQLGFPSREAVFWKPVPQDPENYVALGTVSGSWGPIGQSVPPVGAAGAVCVRRDLTAPGDATQLWNDAGSGSSLPLMSLWRTGARIRSGATPAYPTHEQLYLGAAASVMVPNRTDPATVPAYEDLVRVLKIRPPVLVEAEYPGWLPTLTSLIEPPDDSQPIATHSILVPMTAFVDFTQQGAPNLHTMIEDSPFFVLERREYWNKEFWGTAGGRRNWTSGIQNNTTQTSWQQSSVEVTGSFGFELKGISGSVTATVTQTLGFASSTSVSTFEETQTEVDVPAPPPGGRVALWRKRNEFTLFQHGESGLEPALSPWVFDTRAFHVDTFR